MQVTSVNSTAASAISPQPAEDTARRADDFARVLQNAFYGAGSKAVASGAQQASQDSTPRTETRPVERTERPVTERPVTERPVEQRAEQRQDQRPAERSDDAAKTDSSAPRDQAAKPADKPAQKTEDKPAAEAKPATDETAADAKPTGAPKADGESKSADAAKTAAEAGEELADAQDETKPAVAAAPDAALILSLLQIQMPAAGVAVVPTATPVVEGEVATPVVAPVAAAPVAAAPVAEAPVATAPVAAPQVPADAAAAALAAAAATVAAAGQAPAEVAAPQAGVDAAAQDAAAKAAAQALADAAMAQQQKPAADATQTSVAALLSQQQTMSKEDFAAIQQALAAQAQAQLQDDVKTVVDEPQPQVIAQPQVAVAVAPKSEGKPEKNAALTVDVQTVSAVAPKTLVDQSALMSMQGDDEHADAALLQQQMQAQAQQQQPVGAEVKFAATLQSQLVAEAPQPLNPAAVQASPAHLVSQTGPAPAGQSAQAAQASHAAQQQTLARNLNAYIPAGEQVAVQIKKGAAEGIDKISIRLDPGNLGNVEIKMEVGHDGRLMAVIAADKPETLQMLQKDAASLEQSLRDAGLKTDQQSLSFSLRDQNQAQSGRDGRDGNGYGRQRGRSNDEYADTGRIDPAQVAAAQAQRAAAARGGLDIKI